VGCIENLYREKKEGGAGERCRQGGDKKERCLLSKLFVDVGGETERRNDLYERSSSSSMNRLDLQERGDSGASNLQLVRERVSAGDGDRESGPGPKRERE